MSAAMLNRAVTKLRRAGHKITNARYTILSVLCESDRHLTSSDILERVEARDDSIGRASVFRTLELLTELGVVRPTYLERHTPNYIVMPSDGHHAHLICTSCNLVIELEECPVTDILSDISGQHGVQLTGHLLELYGICSECEP